MPKRPRTHKLADQAINRLHAQFEQCGWTVEDLSKDYGEDLFVRIFENELATPYSFFVQAKATDNIAKHLRSEADVFGFPIETGHLRHWIRFSEPVFLTLYDSSSDRTFWVCVQSAVGPTGVSDKTYKKKSLSIAVPCRNLLDSDGLLRMRGITKLRFERNDRERRGAELLIDILEERFNFKVDQYDPDNDFVQIDTDLGAEYFWLGATAQLLEKIIARSGMKKEEVQEVLVERLEAWLAEPQTAESRARSRRLSQEREDNKERDAGK
jgi:hypothetical protein